MKKTSSSGFTTSLVKVSNDFSRQRGVDVYKGITPLDGPIYQKVFGGQIIRHARVNVSQWEVSCLSRSGPGRVWDISSSVAKASLPSVQDEIFGFCRALVSAFLDSSARVTQIKEATKNDLMSTTFSELLFVIDFMMELLERDASAG
ncbi:hypothetical protein Tco_0676052 [Tanacetum coccineum]